MKEKVWTRICSIAQQEEIVACWTFNKIICTNAFKGRNLFLILILFLKQETMTVSETSCYEVGKSIIVGNYISANKQFLSTVENQETLKQEGCCSGSSDNSDESSSDENDFRLVV